MPQLKLIALDNEDLSILAAHLQDAVLQVGDMAYLPKEHRFAAIANRFDWLTVIGQKPGAAPGERRRCAFRFERVTRARLTGFRQDDTRRVLSLLAVEFQPAAAQEEPGGIVRLLFAGGAQIELDVECIEAELKDLEGVWAARSRPEHPD